MSSRRQIIKKLLVGATAAGLGNPLLQASCNTMDNNMLKGNINHSVCRWTFNHLNLDELCVLGKSIGLKAIDLVGPKEWSVLKKHGLDSSMCNGAELNIVDGWIDPKFHQSLIERYTEHINLVADAGYKNLILFAGNRRGMDEETGMKNMIAGIKKILSLAEKRGVILQVEVFNSKVDHKDYMADNTPWTIELCKQLGSENFKILYDIYHMQIMEGDIIHTIKDHHQYFGHYHTAGVPGRHEIEENQELYYPAIMKAIADVGFKGYVAQEFIPQNEDKAASLRKAVMLCDV